MKNVPARDRAQSPRQSEGIATLARPPGFLNALAALLHLRRPPSHRRRRGSRAIHFRMPQ